MLCPNPRLKAIFFDLDNVLVFSEILHFKAWQEVMVSHGVEPSQLNFQDMIGKSDLLQAQLLTERFDMAAPAHMVWEQKKDLYLALCHTGFEYPAGRNVFLEKLAQFYKIGLVSSCEKRAIQAVLKSENISHYFEFIIGFEDCQKHKPHPEPYLYALEKAKVAPHEALVVEDSVSGISSAQAAKIPVVGIFKDQSPEQLISDVRYFSTFTDLDGWLHA